MHDPANVPTESSALTPREIDARHARHLLDRALSQLEKGERAPAALSAKQAVHLAPVSPRAHSVVGLIALLEADFDGAINSYEKVTGTYEDGATERERLVALKMARTSKTPPSVASLVPNLSAEIIRLRHAVQTAPMAEFYNTEAANTNHTAPAAAGPPVTAPLPQEFVPPPPAAPTVISDLDQPIKTKRPMPWAIMAGAAIVAGLLAFFIVRSATEPTELPSTNGGPATGSPAAVLPATTPTPADGDNDAQPSGTPTPATPVAAVTPAPAPAATRPAPAGKAAPPRPSATRPPAPASNPDLPTPDFPTPRPAPTPGQGDTVEGSDPNYPPMPKPRLTLPSAGHDPPEYTRVNP